MPHSKLFDNHRQIVFVGLQKEFNGVLPNVDGFRAKVNIKIQTEKYISGRNKTIHKFCDKWKIFI